MNEAHTHTTRIENIFIQPNIDRGLGQTSLESIMLQRVVFTVCASFMRASCVQLGSLANTYLSSQPLRLCVIRSMINTVFKALCF